MEENKSPTSELLNELVGKKIVVKTHGGSGIKDVLLIEGDYTGTLIGFDHNFIKLEYRIIKFLNGVSTDLKGVILINMEYIITIEEFRPREEQT
jgi:small nuclear ribonucleoprotein (snRNP)-like protein